MFPAAAAAASPWWHLSSAARPTVLPAEAGKEGEITLTVANLGDDLAVGKATPEHPDGAPIVIADTLPAGLKLSAVEAIAGGTGLESRGPVLCQKAPLTCSFEGTLPPFDVIEVRIKVEILPGAESGERNQVSVSGGLAPAVSLSRPLALGPEPARFGVASYEVSPEEEGGGLDTQAGSHPFQLTTSFELNQTADAYSVALPKDLRFELPRGLLGNPRPFPPCEVTQFYLQSCPPGSAVGVAAVSVNEPGTLGVTSLALPVFELEPSPGEAARFGLLSEGIPVFFDVSAPGPGADELTIAIDNVTQATALLGATLTLWGVPGDARHDQSRGRDCLQEARESVEEHAPCRPLEEAQPPPLLTLPTACTGPLQASGEVDSWPGAGDFLPFATTVPLPALDGCNRLPFAPTIKSEPTSDAATSPTGLGFDLDFDDEGLLAPQGLAQSQAQRLSVTLPEGMSVNPSVAVGLRSCTPAQFGATSVDFAPTSGCPEESKIGSVTLESPLASQPLAGSIYLASQGENPFGSLLALYVVARNPTLGLLVKLAGKVELDQGTGQVSASFDELPQLPLSGLHLAFRSGPRSLLVSPPACGSAAIAADLTPRSNPVAVLQRTSTFAITAGPEGGPCPGAGAPPFHPDLRAGSLNPRAGAYSPFSIHLARKDSEAEISSFAATLPPGVAAKLAGVSSCPAAALAAAGAAAGVEEEEHPSCPASSEVGHSLIGVGVGGTLAYVPGRLYLAGPDDGSPLSIAAITPARPGPLDLGTILTRFALRIDPRTAQVSLDSTGSEPIPRILDGIPLHLRDIRLLLDRPGFTLNPTSCNPSTLTSTLTGSAPASPAVQVSAKATNRFQVGDCAKLGFKPKLALRLSGPTHRSAYPKLEATVIASKGNANLKKAAITLPSTELFDNAHIKAVCTRARFSAGRCPAASAVGHAEAWSPLLDKPLQGTIYLRASRHKLPDLAASLAGQIHLNLAARVDSIGGRIRASFGSIPDIPLARLRLALLGGKRGLFVNDTDLCAARPRAAVQLTAQNAKVRDTRPYVKTACPDRGKPAQKHRSARE
ncbi:MAG: hypothetical protein H0X42_04945 [Solirubrobacterales bacterium]|nr:hypothetical protein [Solirubrobacterales bacterium]